MTKKAMILERNIHNNDVLVNVLLLKINKQALRPVQSNHVSFHHVFVAVR